MADATTITHQQVDVITDTVAAEDGTRVVQHYVEVITTTAEPAPALLSGVNQIIVTGGS